MLTVNLEKELKKQRQSVLVPKELLAIKEYETVGDIVAESAVLHRIGLSKAAREGKRVKEKLDRIQNRLKSYDKDRVYHISQIEKLCVKYHLRFLSTEYFKGSVDAELASKVSTFEVAMNEPLDRYSFKIAAPASSFQLEARPKDPLLFYDLGDDYYYLVHKWGNDLSVFRTVLRYLTSAWLPFIAWFSVLTFVFMQIGISAKDGVTGWGCALIVLAVVSLVAFLKLAVEEEEIRFVSNEAWDSHYFG